MNKTQFKLDYRAGRIASPIDKAIERNAKRVFRGSVARSLAMLARDIRADVAPQIAALREMDNFYASGKSLLAFIKERTNNSPLPAWAKPAAPALPILGRAALKALSNREPSSPAFRV